jgi:hypothetical protein
MAAHFRLCQQPAAGVGAESPLAAAAAAPGAQAWRCWRKRRQISAVYLVKTQKCIQSTRTFVLVSTPAAAPAAAAAAVTGTWSKAPPSSILNAPLVHQQISTGQCLPAIVLRAHGSGCCVTSDAAVMGC